MLDKLISFGCSFLVVTSSTPSTPINKSLCATYNVRCQNDNEEKDSMEILKLVDNMNKLNLFLNFEQNWNGNGADPFSTTLINRVGNILNHLRHQPQVFPTANDSIQLEYEKENGEYLEFEIFENGNIHMLKVDSDDREYEEDNVDLNTIIGLVGDFYGNT